MSDIKFKAVWNGEIYHVLLIDWLNNLIDLEWSNIEIPFSEVELLQYTGLTDSNNIDIYEGDIIEHLHMVYMGEGNIDEQTEIVAIEDITKLPFDGSSLGATIVGNIYEDVEMLEDDK